MKGPFELTDGLFGFTGLLLSQEYSYGLQIPRNKKTITTKEPI